MYGILVNPDPSQKIGAWFLHRCQHESQTFQCNPDPDTWYTFDSVEEARTWFKAWHKQRKEAKRWLPPKMNFRINEIPKNPITKAVTKDQLEHYPVDNDFKTIC